MIGEVAAGCVLVMWLVVSLGTRSVLRLAEEDERIDERAAWDEWCQQLDEEDARRGSPLQFALDSRVARARVQELRDAQRNRWRTATDTETRRRLQQGRLRANRELRGG